MFGKKKPKKPSKKSGNITVEVTTVPTSGSPTSKSVDVPKTGSTIGAVLKAAGIRPDGKDIYLNDRPTDTEAHITDGQSLSVRDRPQVRVNERPRGS